MTSGGEPRRTQQQDTAVEETLPGSSGAEAKLGST